MPQDFRPTAAWEVLRLRSDLLRKVRDFFHARAFIEVETPLLSHDVVVDRHLDPLRVTLPYDPHLPDRGRTMWLQTSPEFGMKRLMASGGEAIYQITRAFRAAEQGSLHNPEFTIIEWYRRGDTYEVGMALLSDFAGTLLNLGPAQRLTYAQVFQQYASIDPHRATKADLVSKLVSLQIDVPRGMADDRDMLLDLLLTERIEPHLGLEAPTILCDYPPSQAALAQIRKEDPPVAERFELYVRGIELANGYHELLDPHTLRHRSTLANQARAAAGKPILPSESRLLAAMEHGLPPCTGCALGFDRLVMLAAGAEKLSDVIAFPIDRA